MVALNPHRVLVLVDEQRAERIQWPDGFDVRMISVRSGQPVSDILRAVKTIDPSFTVVAIRGPGSVLWKALTPAVRGRVIAWPHGLGRLSNELRRLYGFDVTPRVPEIAQAPREEAPVLATPAPAAPAVPLTTLLLQILALEPDRSWSIEEIQLMADDVRPDRLKASLQALEATKQIIRDQDGYRLLTPRERVLAASPAPAPASVPPAPPEGAPMPPATKPVPVPSAPAEPKAVYLILYRGETTEAHGEDEAIRAANALGSGVRIFKEMRIRVNYELVE